MLNVAKVMNIKKVTPLREPVEKTQERG